MANSININANLDANPPKETAYKCVNKGKEKLNCAVACVLCFENDSVFGSTTLSLNQGDQDVAITGSVGASSRYRIYASGTTCPAWSPVLDDPFEITIGS